MRLTLRQLQIFQAISAAGSTIAGAAQVSLSQSAASAALNELEVVLGTRLFDRVGKRIVLNDSGRVLMPAALALLDGARSIEANFSAGASGGMTNLRLFASTTIGNYVMPQLLAQFQGEFPRSRVELRIGNTSDVIAAVQNYAVDLGFIEGPPQNADLQLTPWLTDELVIIAATNHPLLGAEKPSDSIVQTLSTAHWLLREPGSGTREAVEAALLPHIHNVESVTVLGSSEAIKHAVAEGMGLSCLSRYVVQDLVSAGRLRILDTGLPRLTRQFWWVCPRDKVLSAALTHFLGYCRRAVT